MASKIDVIIQHALRTFKNYIRKAPEFSQADIHELRSLTDALSSTDIHELRHFSSSRGLSDFLRKKMTSLYYLPVYADSYISVGVFVLGEGAKLPLHDHPDMHGIIKVLEGILKVTSYSFIDFDKSVEMGDENLFYNNPLKVIKHPEIVLGKQDDSCLLTPKDKNIHEVECVRGPAAFLDILAPPYEDGEANESRSCHYFEEVENNHVKDEFLRLVQVERSF